MPSGYEFNRVAGGPAVETGVAIVAAPHRARAKVGRVFKLRTRRSSEAKETWTSDVSDQRQMIGSLAASCLIHAAVALYVGTSPHLQIFVSEIGRNSVAMISSQGNNAPPNDMQVILETMELSVTAENVDAKSPANMTDQRKPAASAVKKQETSTPEVIARRANSPEKADDPAPSPLPHEMARAELAEQPIPVPPPRLERSKLDPESKPEQARVSAASIASLGSEPLRGADVDRPPRPVHNPAPEYPATALSNRQTGRVVLRVRSRLGWTSISSRDSCHQRRGRARCRRVAGGSSMEVRICCESGRTG